MAACAAPASASRVRPPIFPATSRAFPGSTRRPACASRRPQGWSRRTAEIKSGDLLIAIDGVPVLGIDDLLRLLNHERVNHEAKISLLRRGERRDRYVTPVEQI